MRRSWFVVFALVALSGHSAVARQQPKTYDWVGTGTATWSFAPAEAFDATDFTGALTDARTLNLRIKESRTFDVVNASGSLIGQIIWLEDDGTTWTGTVTDSETHLGTIRMLGDGGASGDAMVVGVMYRSAVTPNPLADVLADGAYTFSVHPRTPIPYRYTLVDAGKVKESRSEISTNAMFVGDARLSYRLAKAGARATEASVRAAMSTPVPDGIVSESGTRALIDGRATGEYSQAGAGDAKGSTMTATWNLQRMLAVHPTLTEVSKAWRPQWTDDVRLTASIDPSLGIKGRFRFTLYDVSSEPGLAVNRDSAPGLDLVFPEEQPAAMTDRVDGDVRGAFAARVAVIETVDETTRASVTVRVEDFGASGKVKAEVFYNGMWHVATTARGKAFSSLPIDDNNNHIADSWESEAGIPGHSAEEDLDSAPTGSNRGDGFSNYEEYRGFYVSSVWESTDPTIKDLFVNNTSTPEDECGYLSRSGVFCRSLYVDEFRTADRVVNFNHDFGHAGEQKALLIRSGGLGVGVMGQAFPAVGPPNDVTEIVIDHLKLNDALTSAGTGASSQSLELIRKSVTAHEIGHGINLDHHGG